MVDFSVGFEGFLTMDTQICTALRADAALMHRVFETFLVFALGIDRIKFNPGHSFSPLIGD